MPKKAIPALLLCFLMISCQKKTDTRCTLTCSNVDIGLQATGFTDSEMDTVVLRQYYKNDLTRPVKIITMFDIITVSTTNIIGVTRLDCNYDWYVYLPSTKTTYSITEVTTEGKYSEEADCLKDHGCYNNIISGKLNGSTFSGSIVTLRK
jgi:hypothetical protein